MVELRQAVDLFGDLTRQLIEMKDLIIPHILRDRIIMYIKPHLETLTEDEKSNYVQEIVDTYFKVLNISKDKADIYCLFFSIMTNYEGIDWILNRLRNQGEDKSYVFDCIRTYAYSSNLPTHHKKDMSNILRWRYDQNEDIQIHLDRLTGILTGKTLVQINQEVIELTK